MGRAALTLFVRAPVPGEAKTRLAAVLGPERAASLYEAFVVDTVTLATSVTNADVELACAGDPSHPFLVAEGRGLPRLPQAEGQLGPRISDALGRGLAARGRAVVIGSDAPTLPSALVARAIEALDVSELVLGPCHDGGFYLLGARVPPRLDGVRWSSAHALADTLARNRDRAVALLPPWYDVDTPDDLRLLRTHLALRPSAAPATAARLARF